MEDKIRLLKEKTRLYLVTMRNPEHGSIKAYYIAAKSPYEAESYIANNAVKSTMGDWETINIEWLGVVSGPAIDGGRL